MDFNFLLPSASNEDNTNSSSTYLLTLTIGKNVFASQGETIEEALFTLPLIHRHLVKYRGIVRVEKDGKSAEAVYFVPALRRLLGNQAAKRILAKRLAKSLK